VVLEAMKMENEIRAPHAGKVGSVLVAPDDSVTRGAILVEIV
jgi:biotin carboxyl carrier protein